jgi:hypothetical protein
LAVDDGRQLVAVALRRQDLEVVRRLLRILVAQVQPVDPFGARAIGLGEVIAQSGKHHDQRGHALLAVDQRVRGWPGSAPVAQER